MTDDNTKIYYSISEVCARTGLEPHVLRYWESEFPQLRPKKNRAGNRAYRHRDIRIIDYIKYLLYEEKYTITGAKKKLSEWKGYDDEIDESERSSSQTRSRERVSSINALRDELVDLLRLIRT